MRAIIQLVTVIAFVGMLLSVLAVVVHRRRRRGRTGNKLVPAHQAETTMKVPALRLPKRDDGDIEGKTVRAPMAASEAYQMHQRYAPAFDQQAAIHRYEQTYGHEQDIQHHERGADFDQAQYERALAAFPDEPRTTLGHAAPRSRIARGSYTEQQYQQYGVQPRPVPGQSTLRERGKPRAAVKPRR